MQQFFTQRRGGAKWRDNSKHRRIVGHAIGDALNAVLDQVVADEAKNLSALAPLRDTSAIQGRNEFFTLRRGGAKWRDNSKHRRIVGHAIGDALNAVLDQVVADEAKNLSALAPLRETSAIQSREESFSPRREGAKRTDTSNGQISVSNLCALAPLRETFGSEMVSRRDAKAQRGRTNLKHPGFSCVDHPGRGFTFKSSQPSVFARDIPLEIEGEVRTT